MEKSYLTVEKVMGQMRKAMGIKEQTQNGLLKENDDVDLNLKRLDNHIEKLTTKWDIISFWKVTSHRKYIGKFIIFFKRLTRKFTFWYIDPIAQQQRDFNSNVVQTINNISVLLEDINDKVNAIQKSMIEKDKKEELDIDYFGFEDKFRGTQEDIKRRQTKYVEYFRDKKNVLDIGCGRGEFLELLAENGIGATGIDINKDMVIQCQEKDLSVIESDLFDYLEAIDDDTLDGIFAAQVIEHLTPNDMLRFIRLAYRKLRKKGVIILETINPENIIAISNWFYMDLTHVRPVHPITLQFLMNSEGFELNELIYSNPMENCMIPQLALEGVSESTDEFNKAIEHVNKVLYGPQDYAIVSIKECKRRKNNEKDTCS
ncbi:bifunctional 2-polyprenyl-6-hydroxyphenol methylase/3-demethylubiquinol 3-O-methyltransferase UbiG [Clostridium sp. DJ247]|uniref:class I SAM-dependent methyltransferase n=1 Tax=Clostridium sp. DJ247 TaxID=2726188 RepID=UPI001628A84B|nr:class I SAM-dependent methyltransferase [Clostridium sp. DJ247]MBC2581572.1 class I SAM-dependent methyltransferase [Clostridium sp. DJ247]